MIPDWNEDARKARIKAIKAATGPRGTAPMDDDTYRAMIGTVCPGKRSATELTVPQLDKVLNHIKRLSVPASPADEWRFTFSLAADRQAHARKIYRLAQRCGVLMEPPRPIATKAWVEGIASRMAGAETVLEFCDAERLRQVVQALEVFCKRRGV